MNHNDQVTETEAVVYNVELWIDDSDTDEAADITVDQAAQAMDDAGIQRVSLPRRLTFDGQYHVDVTREWWDAMVRSGSDLDAEVHPGLHVHLALV
jgi:hypothetical protein